MASTRTRRARGWAGRADRALDLFERLVVAIEAVTQPRTDVNVLDLNKARARRILRELAPEAMGDVDGDR